jgi:serine/threonine protein kinase
VNVTVEELPQFKPRIIRMDIRYPFWMAQRILQQSVEALAFLHEQGIVHSDFRPSNMFFGLNDINSVSEDTLAQKIDAESYSTSPPVKRLDGRHGPWAPEYLCAAQPPASYKNRDVGFTIKLSDMGGGESFPIELIPNFQHLILRSILLRSASCKARYCQRSACPRICPQEGNPPICRYFRRWMYGLRVGGRAAALLDLAFGTPKFDPRSSNSPHPLSDGARLVHNRSRTNSLKLGYPIRAAVR